jgi:hypothetical protein
MTLIFETAGNQVESVARASAGLPRAERKKYITPVERCVRQLGELVEHRSRSDLPVSPEDAAGLGRRESDAESGERAGGELLEQLEQVRDRLTAFDEHLQSAAVANKGPRWFGVLRR